MVDFDSIPKLIDDDSVDAIGPPEVTFEVDHPHVDVTWPNSYSVAQGMILGNTIKQPGLDLKW